MSPPPISTSAPADRALAFLSKSLHDVQKGAETDLKLIGSRAKSLQQIASNFDDWENIKFPAFPLGSGKDVTAGKIFKQIQENSKALSRPLSFNDFDVLKSIEKHVKMSPALSKFQRDLNQPYTRARVERETRRLMEGLKPFSGKGFITLDDWNNAVSSNRWRLVGGWEPLKRVKEGLKEFESSTSHKTPSELFEMVKKRLTIPEPPRLAWSSKPGATDVPPLDVPELLESLIKNLDPLLDNLGVKHDITAEFRKVIQSQKRKILKRAQDDNAESAIAMAAAADWDNLDKRISEVMESTGYTHKDGLPPRRKKPTPEDGRRSIAIVTTASLPWMTGTAVNPLLRAAYLASYGEQDVTLLVPWLAKEDQLLVYPNNITFESPAQQEQYVRDWLENRVGFSPQLKITFYPGKFSMEKRSILAAGDISSFVSDHEADVAVLEEPEHLTWYYHGKRWTDKFSRVVGIIHTNYLEYVRREKNGPLQAFFLEHVNNWMVRSYCHKVVRLSEATQDFPRSMVCNVHGVGVKFLNIGDMMRKEMQGDKNPFSKGAYYLGKMVWGKGYRELVDLLAENKGTLGSLKVDVFGSGEDSADVQAEARAKGLCLKFHKGRDHADTSLHQFKVFINPSISDVVCTTTAEALAMGKIVVCADHPSNDFFRSFPNCLIYHSHEEFAAKVQEALRMEPKPLTPEQRHMLSWEAATQRFMECADLKLPSLLAPSSPDGTSELLLSGSSQDSSQKKQRSRLPRGLESALSLSLSTSISMPNLTELVDKSLAFTHFVASGVEPWRKVAGAMPETMHIGNDLSKDLGLPPPWAQRPTYGW